jgi:hypothetical protein
VVALDENEDFARIDSKRDTVSRHADSADLEVTDASDAQHHDETPGAVSVVRDSSTWGIDTVTRPTYSTDPELDDALDAQHPDETPAAGSVVMESSTGAIDGISPRKTESKTQEDGLGMNEFPNKPLGTQAPSPNQAFDGLRNQQTECHNIAAAIANDLRADELSEVEDVVDQTPSEILARNRTSREPTATSLPTDAGRPRLARMDSTMAQADFSSHDDLESEGEGNDDSVSVGPLANLQRTEKMGKIGGNNDGGIGRPRLTRFESGLAQAGVSSDEESVESDGMEAVADTNVVDRIPPSLSQGHSGDNEKDASATRDNEVLENHGAKVVASREPEEKRGEESMDSKDPLFSESNTELVARLTQGTMDAIVAGDDCPESVELQHQPVVLDQEDSNAVTGSQLDQEDSNAVTGSQPVRAFPKVAVPEQLKSDQEAEPFAAPELGVDNEQSLISTTASDKPTASCGDLERQNDPESEADSCSIQPSSRGDVAHATPASPSLATPASPSLAAFRVLDDPTVKSAGSPAKKNSVFSKLSLTRNSAAASGSSLAPPSIRTIEPTSTERILLVPTSIDDSSTVPSGAPSQPLAAIETEPSVSVPTDNAGSEPLVSSLVDDAPAERSFTEWEPSVSAPDEDSAAMPTAAEHIVAPNDLSTPSDQTDDFTALPPVAANEASTSQSDKSSLLPSAAALSKSILVRDPTAVLTDEAFIAQATDEKSDAPTAPKDVQATRTAHVSTLPTVPEEDEAEDSPEGDEPTVSKPVESWNVAPCEPTASLEVGENTAEKTPETENSKSELVTRSRSRRGLPASSMLDLHSPASSTRRSTRLKSRSTSSESEVSESEDSKQATSKRTRKRTAAAAVGTDVHSSTPQKQESSQSEAQKRRKTNTEGVSEALESVSSRDDSSIGTRETGHGSRSTRAAARKKGSELVEVAASTRTKRGRKKDSPNKNAPEPPNKSVGGTDEEQAEQKKKSEEASTSTRATTRRKKDQSPTQTKSANETDDEEDEEGEQEEERLRTRSTAHLKSSDDAEKASTGAKRALDGDGPNEKQSKRAKKVETKEQETRSTRSSTRGKTTDDNSAAAAPARVTRARRVKIEDDSSMDSRVSSAAEAAPPVPPITRGKRVKKEDESSVESRQSTAAAGPATRTRRAKKDDDGSVGSRVSTRSQASKTRVTRARKNP